MNPLQSWLLITALWANGLAWWFYFDTKGNS
jgi:hypothetical protein